MPLCHLKLRFCIHFYIGIKKLKKVKMLNIWKRKIFYIVPHKGGTSGTNREKPINKG